MRISLLRFLRSFGNFGRRSCFAWTPAIFLPVVCETAKNTESTCPSTLSKIPPIIPLTQLQIDATISVFSQLILDLESRINTLKQLELEQHTILQSIASDPSNTFFQDELTRVRNQWNSCVTRCADLEYSLEIAVTTLEHSLDLAVLVTPLFSKEDPSMLDRAGSNLILLQKTFEDLKKERVRLIQAWNARISEHIRTLPAE